MIYWPSPLDLLILGRGQVPCAELLQPLPFSAVLCAFLEVTHTTAGLL